MKTFLPLVLCALLFSSCKQATIFWSTPKRTATGKVNVMRSMYTANHPVYTNSNRINKNQFCPAMQQRNPVKLSTVRRMKRVFDHE